MVLVFGALIPGNPEAAKGAAVGLFTYIAFFGATWLPLPWLYPAEVNPIKTRGKANAVSTCTNWLFNFLIVMITPTMIANIGKEAFLCTHRRWTNHYRLGHISILCCRKRMFSALYLYLLSGDGKAFTRRDRPDICKGPPREYELRQSCERTAVSG